MHTRLDNFSIYFIEVSFTFKSSGLVFAGFSETETRFKHTRPKTTKTHDIRKKDKQKKINLKLQEKKQEIKGIKKIGWVNCCLNL